MRVVSLLIAMLCITTAWASRAVAWQVPVPVPPPLVIAPAAATPVGPSAVRANPMVAAAVPTSVAPAAVVPVGLPAVGPPVSAPSPLAIDVLQRLDQAEAEIRALRQRLAAAEDRNGAAAPRVAALPAVVQTPGAGVWPAGPLSEAGYAPNSPPAGGGAPPKAEPPKLPNITVNGVFQADAGWFSQDATSLAEYGRIEDGSHFRRARLSAKGAVTDSVNYFFQMDFGFFGRPTFTDVWLEQTKLPILGNWRIGQWKQPFSLEVVSSFRYTTFMERSLLFVPFTPFRHLGTGFYNHDQDENITWAASVFRSGQDQYGGSLSTDGGWGTAERITFLPYYDVPSEGRYYLHLGAAHFFNSPPRDLVNFRTIPEFYVGENAPGTIGTSGVAAPGMFNGTPFFVKTGPLNVSEYNVIGTEMLWVHGPISWQTEAMFNMVNLSGPTAANLWGFYSQVGYFLTGEHRPYDRKLGQIDRVKPFEDFFRIRRADGRIGGGRGAWEVAARLSHIHLNSNGVRGGTMTDITGGVNWYWNAYSKLVFNYILAMPDTPGFGTSHTHIFGTRAQIDF